MSHDSYTRQRVYDALIKRAPGYASGEDLGQLLGLSRTAIWKAISSLRKKGFTIESLPGRGYRFVGSQSDLTAESLESILGQRFLKYSGDKDDAKLKRSIEYLTSTTSTNDVAKSLARQGFGDGTLVIAEEQTAGRGRLARTWVSPSRKGLWFSMLLRPYQFPLAEATKLTGATAVAICEVLTNHYGLTPRIKWPNDIYLSGRKVCGILTEVGAEVDAVSWVVLGIGINTCAESEDFPPEVAPFATSLNIELGAYVDRLKLIGALVPRIERLVCEVSGTTGNWPHIHHQLANLSCVLGNPVRVTSPDGSQFEGEAIELGRDGSLLVRQFNGTCRTITAGDVHLRVVDDMLS